MPGPVPPDRDCILANLILAAGLLDPAQLVGADQLFEVVHPLPEVFSLIGLLHEDAMILRFQNVLLGDDVDVLIHGLFRADERLMGTQGHGAAGIDQRVARDACEGYDDETELYYGRSAADSPDIDGLVHFEGEEGGVRPGGFYRVKVTNFYDGELVGVRYDDNEEEAQ